jgi:hypothetical protein
MGVMPKQAERPWRDGEFYDPLGQRSIPREIARRRERIWLDPSDADDSALLVVRFERRSGADLYSTTSL